MKLLLYILLKLLGIEIPSTLFTPKVKNHITDNRIKKIELPQEKPNFIYDILPINKFSNPNISLYEVIGIVWHWIGYNTSQNPFDVNRYFASLNGNKYASAHITIKDDICLVNIPFDKIAYHAGAYPPNTENKTPMYTNLAMEKLGGNVNYKTLSVELCPDTLTSFSDQTIKTAIRLKKWFNKEFGLSNNDHYRHYDITEKDCPHPWVLNENKWLEFKEA